MRFTIYSQLIILLVVLTVVPLSILAIKATNDLDRAGQDSLENLRAVGGNAVSDSTQALNDMGAEMIRTIAVDVARQLEIYIRSHPEMTVEDLQEDPYFSSLAVQPVGETGYTAITDVDSLVCRFHANPAIVNLDLQNLAETLPGFWSVMSRSEGGMPSYGYYDWLEADGTTKQKYMYIAIVNATTADGVQFSVAATTYIDEFNAPVLQTQAKIDSVLEGEIEKNRQAMQEIKSEITFLIVFMIVLTVIVGMLFARSVTVPIVRLTESARKIADGDLHTQIPEIKSKSEIRDLADTMGLLAGALQYLRKEKEGRKK